MGTLRLTRPHGNTTTLQAELEVLLSGYTVPRITYITRIHTGWTGSSDDLRALVWQRFCQSPWTQRMKETQP